MYSLHMKYLSTMADMALTCSQAYTTAINAQLKAVAEASDSAGKSRANPGGVSYARSSPQSSGESENPPGHGSSARTFAFPEIPEPGQSWYRAPYENPFLAFWDQVLSPWRTYSAFGWPALPFTPIPTASSVFPGAHPQPFEAMNVAFAFAPWLQQWSNLTMHMANAMTPAGSAFGAASGAPAGSTAQPGPLTAITLAKIRFPDNTEVTISVPYLPLMFAAAPFAKAP